MLCRTLAGNKVEVLTITNNCRNPDQYLKRKGIIISARVHPGEPVSSWILQGIIDMLISNTQEAEKLREAFIWKIIPMLNPDGVIHGNYRCSLSGKDLNRRWKKPSKLLFPEIYYSKKLILEFSSKYQTSVYLDLHGHSRKKNVFLYGCHDDL